MSESTYIIAGLGNPGPEYVETRHNVGWMVIDRLIEEHGLIPETRREGTVAEARAYDSRILFFKPASYVNTSGKAIDALASQTGVEPENIIVVHDDLDLDFGCLRVKAGGRSGGHRGIDSIIAAVGAEDFIRIKVGIGRPPGRMEPSEFVLKPFTAVEKAEIDVTIAEAGDAAMAVIEDGIEAAMNRYNKSRK